MVWESFYDDSVPQTRTHNIMLGYIKSSKSLLAVTNIVRSSYRPYLRVRIYVDCPIHAAFLTWERKHWYMSIRSNLAFLLHQISHANNESINRAVVWLVVASRRWQLPPASFKGNGYIHVSWVILSPNVVSVMGFNVSLFIAQMLGSPNLQVERSVNTVYTAAVLAS